MTRCTAISKKSGEQCRKNCSPGKTVCHLHDDHTLGGLAHPQTHTGHFSKYLPPRMQTTYKKSLFDPRITSNRESIAIVVSRLAYLYQQFDLVYEDDRIGKAQLQLQLIKKALKNGDQAGLHSSMTELYRLICNGVQEYKIWKQIAMIYKWRIKLIKTEVKWMITSGQMIPKERAVRLFEAAGEIFREEISDPKVLEAIRKNFEVFMAQTPEVAWSENHQINYGEIFLKSMLRGKRSTRQANT